ncbi:SIMPL domain-containing protein [Nonomuraea sp. NPDC003804]|uniref:SIMPL domain-containing protein n=1 Tax=Nonomuraea sp. NPDC003804 TaxID=3154547 RepID=UPI0033B21164
MEETRNQIAVVGQGAVSAAPDVMRLTAGVEVRRATAGEAFAAARAAAAKLTRTLIGAGVAADDLTTNELSLGPEYESYPKVSGYRGAQGVEAVVRDLSKADRIIDAAAAVGEEVRLNGVSFEVSDRTRLMEAARAAAFKDAADKARHYAALAGRRLGNVVEITEEITGGPIPMHVSATLAEDKASVNPGRQNLGINVRVVYELR